MKMDGRIRVKTDRRHRTLYNNLTKVAVDGSHELFFLCACLGYQKHQAKALGKWGEDRFWSSTVTPEEWCSYYAIVLEESEMDFGRIQDDGAVMSRIEEYANGGMDILVDECLKDFLTTSGDDLAVETAMAAELPKVLLQYVFEQGLPAGQAE